MLLENAKLKGFKIHNFCKIAEFKCHDICPFQDGERDMSQEFHVISNLYSAEWSWIINTFIIWQGTMYS